MNKQTKLLMAFLVLSLCIISCSKHKSDADEIHILERDLTPCPANGNCKYQFTEHADFNTEEYTPKSGEYRLFSANVNANGVGFLLYIKAPMKGNSFLLNKQDVISGRVKLINTCASCLSTALEPTDGYVKGINLTPGKPADQTKWIIEASITMGTKTTAQTNNVVNLKQYFYPNFVLN
ncbi:hypothetical protein [Pedobacter sp. MC2016-24]|uniref:hypothetical protein n=1 Tax=Pedobacter sp. MC2016-24 TaxID=2780090 RepID=UPI00188082D6|nr:hypothetical protein [Pedobacter sp. MC2016-24]MBE9603042.1 hypothetical protein [Pedobacter sp. MC2016-24]